MTRKRSAAAGRGSPRAGRAASAGRQRCRRVRGAGKASGADAPPRLARLAHRRRGSDGGLGGLALGLTVLVSIDALVIILAVIPFVGIMVAGRSTVGVPFCIGAFDRYGLRAGRWLPAGAAVHALARPTPELIELIAAWLAALTLISVELLRLPACAPGPGGCGQAPDAVAA